MTGYEVNPISRAAIEKFRNELAEFHIDEDFLKIVFRILDLSKLSPKGKICFLELVIEKFEKDIEILNTQIQSYSFQHPKQFYENLTPPKPKDIVSSFDFLIDESFVCKHKAQIEQLQSWSNIEDSNGKFIHVEMLKEYPENQQIDHIFIDPVANYMELFFRITVQTCFFCKDHSHHQLPVHISALIFVKHDEEAQSWDQLLGWLH
jgi:hypothetical protein